MDTPTFTTTINATISGTAKVDPFLREFKLVSASAPYDTGRVDVHKVTLSLAFPNTEPTFKEQQQVLEQEETRVAID